MPDLMYPILDPYRKKLEEASFSVKLRGYAPEEVDAFLDEISKAFDELGSAMQKVRDYDYWLHEVAHDQIVARARQDADQARAEAEEQLRIQTEAARRELNAEKEKLSAERSRLTRELEQEKRRMELELEQFRRQSQDYRDRAIQALRNALSILETHQRQDSALSPLEPEDLDTLQRAIGT